MDKLSSIRIQIEDQLKRSGVEVDYLHSQLTLKWAIRLKPDADIPCQIAALGHDFERSFPDRKQFDSYKTYGEYKQAHALKSAEMVADLMQKNDFALADIIRTKTLIENHEIGGEGDLQMLTDADSLAFFEGNIPYYRKTHSENDTKNKIIFMYRRVSDNAKPFINQIKFEDDGLKQLFLETIKSL